LVLLGDGQMFAKEIFLINDCVCRSVYPLRMVIYLEPLHHQVCGVATPPVWALP